MPFYFKKPQNVSKTKVKGHFTKKSNSIRQTEQNIFQPHNQALTNTQLLFSHPKHPKFINF